MSTGMHDPRARGAEAGFTLVEALVAIVVLVFGLMAVTNLMLVAASSNTVANQGTAAVTSATRVMDMMKTTSFQDLGIGGIDFGSAPGTAKDCDDPTLALDADWHCDEAVPGVGQIHTHWWVSTTDDPRLLHARVVSQGMGALAGARSRSEFTTFRACTNTGVGCPEVP